MASWSWASSIQGALSGFAAGGIYGAVAGFVVGGLAGGDAQRSQRNKARDAYNAGAQDRDVMVQSSAEPARIVYGRQRVSGPIAFAHSSGSKGERLDLVLLLAPHEIDAVETVWFDDQPLTLDAFGSVTNTEVTKAVIVQASQTVTASSTATLAHAPVRILAVTATWQSGDLGREMSGGVEYTWTSGVAISIGSAPAAAEGGAIITVAYEWEQSRTVYAFVRPQLGTATQAADNPLLTAAAGKWTSAHRLRGIAYLAVTLIYDQDVWGGGGIPNVAATVRGHKIRDPRTGLTAWTDNAALVAAHYVSHYLPGVQASEVPDAELSVEADCCDELVALDALGSTQRRYTIDAAISTETAPKDVLATLESAMAGTITDAQGRILIRAGRHLAPAMTITEDYLAGAGPRILPARSRSTLINKVVPIYSEPSKAWAPVQAPAVSNATYLAADGGVELSTELQLDGVISDSLRAQRLAKIMLERERAALEVTITCNLRAYDLTIGDTVALTLSRYGWSAKLFAVLERSVDLAACTIALRLQETSAAVWDWAYGQATRLDLTPNTSLPSAWARPDVLTGLTAASGTAHLLRLADGSLQCRAWVSWSQSTTATVTQGGRIRVRWRRVDSTVWVEETQQPGDSVGCYIGPLAEQVPVIIAVQPVTVLGRESVSWTVVSHIPAGKTEPPGNVAGIALRMVAGTLVISWDPSTDIDYAETEIRVGASWAAGTLLVVGRQTEWAWPWPAVGSYTLWAKHRDTSGNVSSASAVVTAVITATSAQISTGMLWINASGAQMTWVNGSGATLPWGSISDVVYLIDTPQIAHGAVKQQQIGPSAVLTSHIQPDAATTTISAEVIGPVIVTTNSNSVPFSIRGVLHGAINIGAVEAGWKINIDMSCSFSLFSNNVGTQEPPKGVISVLYALFDGEPLTQFGQSVCVNGWSYMSPTEYIDGTLLNTRKTWHIPKNGTLSIMWRSEYFKAVALEESCTLGGATAVLEIVKR